MVIVGLLVFTLSFLAFTQNVLILKQKVTEIKAQNVANKIAFLINTANHEPGLKIGVALPPDIDGKEYEISVVNKVVNVKMDDKSYSARIFTDNAFFLGENITSIYNDASVIRIE